MKHTIIDTNLNKSFIIKRINYIIKANIRTIENNLYNAEIVSIESGNCPYNVGDSLVISKRELELTGRSTGSIQ